MKRAKSNAARTADYKDFLHKQLQNSKLAASYLTECHEDGPEVFAIALRDVIEARGRKRNASICVDPGLRTLTAILDTLGLKLKFTAKKTA